MTGPSWNLPLGRPGSAPLLELPYPLFLVVRPQQQVASVSDVTLPLHDGGANLLASNASSHMSRQRTRDTEPELALRRELHGRGMRY